MNDPAQPSPIPTEPSAPAQASEPVYPTFEWALTHSSVDEAATSSASPTATAAGTTADGETGQRTAPAQHTTEPYAVPLPAAKPLGNGADRFWGSCAHFAGVLGPLPVWIIWLSMRRRGRFAAQESKEALNFQITVWIAIGALFVVAVATIAILIGYVFIVLIFPVQIAGMIFSIIGGSKSSDGTPYRYPLTFRFIKR